MVGANGIKLSPAAYFLYRFRERKLLRGSPAASYDPACRNDAGAVSGGVFRHEAVLPHDQED
ncbi:hypothetical protein D3C87_2081970 [compost metagenome]